MEKHAEDDLLKYFQSIFEKLLETGFLEYSSQAYRPGSCLDGHVLKLFAGKV